MEEKKWIQKEIDEVAVKIIQERSNVSELEARLLSRIGVVTEEDIQAFFHPDYKTQIGNPFGLRDMEAAVKLISEAISAGKRILCHGDYDCDGVTSSTILKEGFKLLGVEVDVFSPNRFVDGYGLNMKRMEEFIGSYDLIISADTGIRAFPAAKFLKDSGVDLIVTDHHEPFDGKMEHLLTRFKEKFPEEAAQFETLSEEEQIVRLKEVEFLPEEAVIERHGDEFIALPDAYAIIDPKRLGDEYACKTLSGVGIAFKLLQALCIERGVSLRPLFMMLDLVAAGTIADVTPQISRFKGKNDFEVRTMCKFGIDVMNMQPSPWVKAIQQVQGIKAEITSTTIGFKIGPLLNAPGRLEDPMKAVDLLSEKDEEKALEKAKELKAINVKRQIQTEEYEKVIMELEEKGPEYTDYGVVAVSEDFHIGIAGLVASKVLDHYYRPAIALAPIEKDGKMVLKGSARSIAGVNVLKMLDKVKEKIGSYEYGGHEQAAGMTLEVKREDEFRWAFREACMDHDESVFSPCEFYDTEMRLEDITFRMIEDLKKFEPYGAENPEPIFRANDLNLRLVKPIMEGKGAKLTFEQDGLVMQGITFNLGEKIVEKQKEILRKRKKPVVDVLFQPSVNNYNPYDPTLQLIIKDIHFQETDD